jgi:hypothetical protein
LSMFRNRFPTGAPPLEMRVMTKERRVGVELADDMKSILGQVIPDDLRVAFDRSDAVTKMI